jgi:UDP-N-acetylmuramate dehydrogenase
VQLVGKQKSGLVAESRLKQILEPYPSVILEEGRDLTKLSTMRLKAVGDLITIKSIDDVQLILPLLNKEKIKYRMLGWGANQLLPKESEIPYITLAFPFDKNYFNEVREVYELPASVSLSIMSSHAVKNGLKGWEVFTGIPASLGGAIFMNAGTNLGEICSIVQEVTLVDIEGKIKVEKINKDSFSYRKNYFVKPGDVIVSAKLIHLGQLPEITNQIKEYLALRNRTQPLKESTCGCIFKNYNKTSEICRAGMFIDIIGLKGFTHKNIQISPKHANFMVNLGDSNLDDIGKTIDIVKKELMLQYGVEFETEVKLE